VNVMVEDKGLLKIFKINESIIKELVQKHSYAIEMKISANFDNSEYEKIVKNKSIIKFRFPCNYNTYHIYFYLICPILLTRQIAYSYVKIGSDFVIFVNRSTYKNNPSLVIMVFPKKFKEALKNGKNSKNDSTMYIHAIAYHLRLVKRKG
ncbi:unnamed protein product, partial [Gordionus sp. m RMFG-2023]